MRSWLFLLLFSMLLALSTSASEDIDWQLYPKDFPKFNYEGETLRTQWPQLTNITDVAYPDVEWIQAMMKRYPRLAYTVDNLALEEDSPLAIKELANGNYAPLAAELQHIWRLHFSGQFKEAYELGMSLSAFGAIPAIYSRLIHATYLVTDPKEKLKEFEACASLSIEGMTLVPDYDFAQFGLVYSRVRMLEILSTSKARSSGYIQSSQETLADLHKRYPGRALYLATEGGLEAGIVERIGSLLGRMTYGATESRAIDNFERALALNSTAPIIYIEYVTALNRLDPKDHKQRISNLLNQCATLPTHSAEEILIQAACNDSQ